MINVMIGVGFRGEGGFTLFWRVGWFFGISDF